MAPYFVWQSQRPEPAYRNKVIREFYYQDELNTFLKIHRASGFVPQTILKALRGLTVLCRHSVAGASDHGATCIV